jgi:hypothetical protein
MADINRIKTDLQKEINGVWKEFECGIKLLIARARNPKYQELLRNLTENKLVEIREDKLDTKDFAEIMIQVRAKTILLDWENIEENGVTVPYSVEKAIEYFSNEELKDFYTFVVAVSENSDQYKKDLIKESEKNL